MATTTKRVHYSIPHHGSLPNRPLCGPPWTDKDGNPSWIGTNSAYLVTCKDCLNCLKRMES